MCDERRRADALEWLRQQVVADLKAASPLVIRYRWEADPEPWAHGDGIRDERGQGVAVVNGGYARDHIIRHGPLDAIADCEAKLAILGEHQRMNGGSLPDWCLICRYQQGPALGTVPWPCRTVRLLADSYKHRLGWADYWRA